MLGHINQVRIYQCLKHVRIGEKRFSSPKSGTLLLKLLHLVGGALNKLESDSCELSQMMIEINILYLTGNGFIIDGVKRCLKYFSSTSVDDREKPRKIMTA